MKFRKKPVEVEAVEFVYTQEGLEALLKFCGSALGHVQKSRHINAKAEAEIRTLEDGKYLTVAHIATEGDWIIRGIEGEFYPCKPKIFWDTYDLV